MSFKNTTFTLATALATSGTVTVGYPSGFQKGNFSGGIGHKLIAGGNTYSAPLDFELTFNANASSITLTWRASTTLAAGTACRLQLERRGKYPRETKPVFASAVENALVRAPLVVIDLGSPDTADADGVCASQSISASGTINGALASGGVATFDVPRNVVAAWTTSAVMTVTGTDVYGNTLIESSGSGTSLAGKKAFKTVTAIAVSTAVTSATVGTGDVLGLPVYLPGTGYVLKELEDGSAATAGTLVAGVQTKPTATTGDVRGTYDPNSACNGDKGFVLIAALPDADHAGYAQYAG